MARRRKKYDLYGENKNQKEFLKHLEQKIKVDPPEVNISEIVDQFYNRDQILWKKPESFKLVF